MTGVNHKTAWREREQPYLRPRISRDDIEQARRDAELAEAEEQAAKRICMVLVAVAVVVVLAVWVI